MYFKGINKSINYIISLIVIISCTCTCTQRSSKAFNFEDEGQLYNKIQNTINKLNRVNLDPNADVNDDDNNNAQGDGDDCNNNNNNNSNHIDMYCSFMSTNYNNCKFTLPERLETVRETMSEQSYQQSLMKSINNNNINNNNKSNVHGVSAKPKTVTEVDENDEKIEILKMVMSIRKMFKEDNSGKYSIYLI